MQPLFSVEHESRSSHQPESGERSEFTPLLQRVSYHRHLAPFHRDQVTLVALLLMLLIFGMGISIYLLVLQSNSENVLPPVDSSLRLVSRSQWDAGGASPNLGLGLNKVKQVVVVQTDTKPCQDTKSCVKLLKSMELNTGGKEALPFNFLVSPQGETYEILGWKRAPNATPNTPSTLVFGFIGNYTETPPTHAQLVEAKGFLAESVSLEHLDPSYTITGHNTKYSPEYLFSSLRSLPQWKD